MCKSKDTEIMLSESPFQEAFSRFPQQLGAKAFTYKRGISDGLCSFTASKKGRDPRSKRGIWTFEQSRNERDKEPKILVAIFSIRASEKGTPRSIRLLCPLQCYSHTYRCIYIAVSVTKPPCQCQRCYNPRTSRGPEFEVIPRSFL